MICKIHITEKRMNHENHSSEKSNWGSTKQDGKAKNSARKENENSLVNISQSNNTIGDENRRHVYADDV